MACRTRGTFVSPTARQRVSGSPGAVRVTPAGHPPDHCRGTESPIQATEDHTFSNSDPPPKGGLYATPKSVAQRCGADGGRQPAPGDAELFSKTLVLAQKGP